MNDTTPLPLAQSSQDNEIILYQPDTTVKIEVRLNNDTVWLTQQQIADLFGVKQPAISKHLKNIFESGELIESSVHSILEYTAADGKSYKTKFYNLDAILSVGYRVNSTNATIFFDGQIFDAYTLMCNLVRSAKHRIALVDNYVDDSVLCQLAKRRPGVDAVIFTYAVSRVLSLDLERHNSQYPPIEIKTYKKAHDRFLIIDDDVYHVGASFKDLGKKLFAFSKMEALSADELIANLTVQ